MKKSTKTPFTASKRTISKHAVFEFLKKSQEKYFKISVRKIYLFIYIKNASLKNALYCLKTAFILVKCHLVVRNIFICKK